MSSGRAACVGLATSPGRCLRPSTAAVLCLAALAPVPTLHAQTLLLTNANIYTADAAKPRAEALVARDGRILFVGSALEARALVTPGTAVIDAGGKTVLPGLIDAHAHLLNLGVLLATVNLRGTPSLDSVVRLVAAQARSTPAGTWIRGRGWDQNLWGDGTFPTHESLSRATPDHPVYLRRVDGHAIFVNQVALERAGITRSTKDPAGGRIIRDARGNPTGVLVDRAMALVESRMPPDSPEDIRRMTRAAIREAHRWGLTGIHDAGVREPELTVYEAMAQDGEFPLRSYVMVRALGDADSMLARTLARGPRQALGNGRLWVRAIKLSVDGALGSRGAALLDPYSDEPGNRGIIQIPQEEVERITVRALRSGFQVNVHAIGDHANRFTLDAFEAALRQAPVADHRLRVEHAQILAPQDLGRFARLGVIPSMQGSHQTSDMYWAVNRLGPGRLLGAYAWRSLRETGVIIPNGSDFPVEQVNPLISFLAAVARQDDRGWPVGGWYPAQRMTREEALRSMTLWPAVAAFQERDLGSLSPGKYADFVILDRDIMTAPPEEILATRVVRTVLGGATVWDANQAN